MVERFFFSTWEDCCGGHRDHSFVRKRVSKVRLGRALPGRAHPAGGLQQMFSIFSFQMSASPPRLGSVPTGRPPAGRRAREGWRLRGAAIVRGRPLVIYICNSSAFKVDSLAFSDEPLMPHCVMRRPVAGAELGLEDPGELMPRSVESNLRGG